MKKLILTILAVVILTSFVPSFAANAAESWVEYFTVSSSFKCPMFSHWQINLLDDNNRFHIIGNSGTGDRYEAVGRTLSPGDTVRVTGGIYVIGSDGFFRIWDANIERVDIVLPSLPFPQVLPNRRLTLAERQEWIDHYLERGGPTATELEVIRLVNIERARYGLALVEMDVPLMMAARFFAQQAADLRGLHSGSHDFGPYADGHRNASANVAAAFGGRLRWHGGNWFSGGSMTAEQLVEGWMDSPGHRNYILSPEHRFIGMGQFPGGISYMFMSELSSIPVNRVTPPPTTATTVTSSGANLNFNINITNPWNYTLIVSTFDSEGRFLEMRTESLTTSTANITLTMRNNIGATNARVMIWDGFGNMNPVNGSEVIPAF